MKLVTFSTKSRTSNTQPASASVPAAALSVDIPTPGVLIGEEIVDLSSLGYPTVLSIIEAGQPALDEIQAKLSKAPRIPLASVIQLSTSQWTPGKSFPTYTPIGPSITTADEVSDPHALSIKLTIDGETLQDSNTNDLIFKIPALIAYISSTTPLEAGDIISTGTPEGVGLGRDPKRWLKPNEEVIITIDKLGALRNRTIAE